MTNKKIYIKPYEFPIDQEHLLIHEDENGTFYYEKDIIPNNQKNIYLEYQNDIKNGYEGSFENWKDDVDLHCDNDICC